MVDIIILVTIIIIVTILWKLYFSKYGDIDQLPGPTSLQLFKIMQQSKAETLNFMVNAPKTYGGVVKLWVKPFAPMLLITDPEIAMKILKSPDNLRKTKFYGLMAVFFGEDLTTQTSIGEWKHDRKEMSPCVATKNLRRSIDIFERNLEGLFTNIRRKLNEPVDFVKLISLYTLESSLEVNTRKRHNIQQKQDYKYITLLTKAFDVISERTKSFILQNNFFFKFTKLYKTGLEAAKTLNELVDLDKSQSNGTGDILDLMINNNIPDDRKHHQLVALIIGAHDTTKSSLCFTMYELSRHPEVQKKLLQETIDLLGTDKSAPITFDVASRMTYMKCVINETLRLNPTIPLIQRILGKDVTYNGNVIPKETNVTISIFSMQRDEKYFDNPLKYDPDRFLPENRDKIPYGAFSPFSAGTRDCFGKHFAILKITCTIAKIIRNFEILPVKDHKLDMVLDFVATSGNGFPVVFRERGNLG